MYVKLDNNFGCQFSPAYHTKISSKLSESKIYSTCEFIYVEEVKKIQILKTCVTTNYHQIAPPLLQSCELFSLYHKFCALKNMLNDTLE